MKKQTVNVHSSGDLPCREKECETVRKFIEQNVNGGLSGTMYISGMPGTGKTASVMRTIRKFESTVAKKLRFRLVLTNGMRVADPKLLFVDICSQLFPTKSRKPVSFNTALLKLQKYFDADDDLENRWTILLVVDEFDVLVTKRQKILYRLFEWSTKDEARLSIITIANTLDLPERMLTHRISSRFGLNRLCFQPYTHTQIEEILKTRMVSGDMIEGCGSKLKLDNDDALQLIARKVAAVSGDLRRALEICRLAVSVYVEEAETDKKCKFGLRHATQALTQIYGGVKIQAVRMASECEKMILKSALAEYNRLGSEEMPANRIHQQYLDFCSSDDIATCSDEEFEQILYNLCELRLLLANFSGKSHLHRKIRLNINPEDLSFALKAR